MGGLRTDSGTRPNLLAKTGLLFTRSHLASPASDRSSRAIVADGGTMRKHTLAATLNALRIVTGILFWQHGAQKVLGWFGGNAADPLTLFGLAGILEFFGGALIVLGLLTRPVAFILAGEMAVAYFRVHLPRGFWPVTNGGELAALYCFIFLLFAVHGGGSLSLDAWIGSWRAGSLTNQPVDVPQQVLEDIDRRV